MQSLISQSQNTMGCADNLYYNFDFKGQLLKEINNPGKNLIYEVAKLDTIILHAKAGHPSCNFAFYPFYFNGTVDSSAKVFNYGYFGKIKFKAQQGKYSVKVKTGSAENTIAFEIRKYQLNPEPFTEVPSNFILDNNKSTGPNPFKDILNIAVNKTSPPEKIVIFNNYAQQIYMQRNPLSDIQVNLSHLPAGFYIIKYIYKDRSESIKLIKE